MKIMIGLTVIWVEMIIDLSIISIKSKCKALYILLSCFDRFNINFKLFKIS